MLLGEYHHTLDPKKRVAVPARFRKELGKRVILTHGFDKCLFIYPLATWSKISEKLSTLPVGTSVSRDINRFMFAGAVPSDVDSLGRILVPDFLKEFADLKSKVVIVGVHDRAEVWNEKEWNEYRGRIEKQADSVAEKLGELGIF